MTMLAGLLRSRRGVTPVIGALLLTIIGILVFGVLYNAYNYLGQVLARQWSEKQEDIAKQNELDIVWIGPSQVDKRLSLYLKNLSGQDLTDLTVEVGGDLESVKKVETGQTLEKGLVKSIPLCDKSGWCLKLEPGRHLVHVASAQGVDYREELVLDIVDLNLTDLTVKTCTTPPC